MMWMSRYDQTQPEGLYGLYTYEDLSDAELGIGAAWTKDILMLLWRRGGLENLGC